MSERLPDLNRVARRRALRRAIARILATWVALFGGYYLAPIATFAGRHVPLILIASSTLFAVVVAWQVRRVGRAKLPVVRAVETLALLIPLFLILFASLYLSLATTFAGNFSEALDHTDSLYFTVTVFATVGFGDIVPVTAVARLLTSVQMMLDLVVLGAVVRIVSFAARQRIGQG